MAARVVTVPAMPTMVRSPPPSCGGSLSRTNCLRLSSSSCNGGVVFDKKLGQLHRADGNGHIVEKTFLRRPGDLRTPPAYVHDNEVLSPDKGVVFDGKVGVESLCVLAEDLHLEAGALPDHRDELRPVFRLPHRTRPEAGHHVCVVSVKDGAITLQGRDGSLHGGGDEPALPHEPLPESGDGRDVEYLLEPGPLPIRYEKERRICPDIYGRAVH